MYFVFLEPTEAQRWKRAERCLRTFPELRRAGDQKEVSGGVAFPQEGLEGSSDLGKGWTSAKTTGKHRLLRGWVL